MPSPVCIWVLLLFQLGMVPSPAEAECTRYTCLNGGTCDGNYKGKHFKCHCPMDNRTDYGPRCEVASRSYYSRVGTIYAITVHDISHHPFHANKLTITYDFVAHSILQLCHIIVIKGKDSKSLLSVERNAMCQNLIWGPAASNHGDRSLAVSISTEPDKYPDAGKSCTESWQSMSIHMWKKDKNQLTTRFQLCSLDKKQCIAKDVTQPYDGDLKGKFKDSTISIGNMMGSVRFPRVNGVIVDLGKSNMVGLEGEKTLTDPYCIYNEDSCLNQKLQTNFCGTDSLCDGDVKKVSSGFRDSACRCRCINDKRRQRETITNNEMCTTKSAPWNECTIATPIVRTGSVNYAVQWTTHNDGPIGVGLKFVTIELSVKSREMDVDKMIALLNGNATLLHIRISKGLPEACTGGATSCYAFPEVSLAEGEWHSLSVSIRKLELITMVDMRTEYYVLGSEFSFPGATVKLSIPNSYVRSIRLSNIYMPVSFEEDTSDNVIDKIKLHKSDGTVTVAETMAAFDPLGRPLPAVGCNCNSSYEDCDLSTGQPRCRCKNGFHSDKEGKCVISPDLIKAIENSGQQLRGMLAAAVFTNLIRSLLIFASIL